MNLSTVGKRLRYSGRSMLRSIVTVLLLLSVFILTGCTDSSAVSEYDATLEARANNAATQASYTPLPTVTPQFTPTPTLVPTATATAIPIKTTVGQLSRDYESNSVVANLKYGNRNVEILGTVDSVDIVALDLDETYNYVEKYVLELEDSDWNRISCVLPDLEQATSTKKGEQVTVTGRILGNYYREVGLIMVHPCRLAAGPN